MAKDFWGNGGKDETPGLHPVSSKFYISTKLGKVSQYPTRRRPLDPEKAPTGRRFVGFSTGY